MEERNMKGINMKETPMNLEQTIRDIPNFPKEGIVFKDLTTLWKEPQALAESGRALAEPFREEGIDMIIGAEARGFICGVQVALELGTGFVPVRKSGKLPAEAFSASYELEYGTDTLTMHKDALKPGSRVLIVDDLVATGGTINAIISLIEQAGGEAVAVAAIVELSFLKPAETIPIPVHSLIKVRGE